MPGIRTAMGIINSAPCGNLYRKVPLNENKPADIEVLNKNFDLIERALLQLRDCLAAKIAAVSGTQIGVPPSSSIPFGVFLPGIDGEDGQDGHGMNGNPGITPKTYFDLELSYGREDGVGTLAAFGTGSEGTPNFYLRPNTDLTVLTVGTGSPGEVWEYEITHELSGDLVLDLCVYQCLVTPQPTTTATLSVSVTKNTTDILTIPNITGIGYSISGTRFTATLPGASYVPGDKIGIHVNTTNFSSGTLMMTAHASCDVKAIAVGSITGPAGNNGTQGFMGPPGHDGEDADYPLIIPGTKGIKGDTGDTGITTQYFDLFLSHGAENGVASIPTGIGGLSPEWYLRPMTGSLCQTTSAGSPGAIWEYQVNEGIQANTIILDMEIYYCSLSPSGGSTPTLVIGVTKNGSVTGVTTSNLDGITGAATRVSLTVLNASYANGDRIGVLVTTTNTGSGALMATVHLRGIMP